MIDTEILQDILTDHKLCNTQAEELGKAIQLLNHSDDIDKVYLDMCKEVNRLKIDELRIVKNFIRNMPKVYRKRTQNFTIVGDILLVGTFHSGMTSRIAKCRELGIDPYTCDLEVSE